jgi:hypothetical protein
MHRIDFRKVSSELLGSVWRYTTTVMGDKEHSGASTWSLFTPCTQLNYASRDHVQGLDLVGRTSQQPDGRERCR